MQKMPSQVENKLFQEHNSNKPNSISAWKNKDVQSSDPEKQYFSSQALKKDPIKKA